MPCRTIRLGDGAIAIVCTRGPRTPRKRRCDYCHRPAHHQCDGPGPRPGSRRTCDRWVCDAHRKHVHPDKDFCPEHAHGQTGERQGRLL